MDSELRARAEARLAEAARVQGIADPRPSYRERLRQLREEQPQAFDRAVRHYEQNVLPALTERDPLPVWLEYGSYLASISSPGEAVSIDAEGRATPWTPGSPAGLVLHIPSDTAAGVMILCRPAELSAAQTASVTLLVERKLSGA